MAQQTEENPQKKIETTELGPRTAKEVWRDWFTAIGKWFWNKFHSPTGIWMFGIWLTTILIMGITNTLRDEPIEIGGKEYSTSFFAGPAYWIAIFLSYGLNTGQDPTSRLVGKPVFNWIFAPMIVICLGVMLFMLPDSGFLRNGAFPQDELDFSSSYKFFNTEVWGMELKNPNNPKMVPMYTWLVWMPIIIGTVLSSLYIFVVFKKIQKREKYFPKATTLLILSLIGSLITGFAMALMTGNITFEFSGILRSLFIERKSNYFFIYGLQYGEEGQYHPFSVGLTMWLINLISFFLVYGMFIIILNMDTIWEKKDYPYRKIKGFFEARKAPDLSLSMEAEA